MDFIEFNLFIKDLPAMNLLKSHPRISLAIKWYTYNRVPPLHSNTTLKSLMKALPFRAQYSTFLQFILVTKKAEHFRNILIKMWSRGAADISSSENHKVAVHFSCRIERILISRQPIPLNLTFFFLFQTSIGWVILKFKIDAV